VQALKQIESVALRQARRGLRLMQARGSRRDGALGRIEDFSIPASDGAPLRSRYYEPPTPIDAPILLFFHGGGFVCCDIDTHHTVCVALALASGLRIISVDYRLAPEAPFPTQLDDARAACAWALQNAEKFGARPGVISVSGDSAGAYLAARMAMELNRDRPGTVALQLLLYPLVHVDDALWAQEELRNFRFLGRIASLYIARALGAEPMQSLLDCDPAGSPTTIMAGGTLFDPVSRDTRVYAKALRDAGVRVVERDYPFLMHGGLNAGEYFKNVDRALGELGALARDELRADLT
jgi:acetyl esterase